RQERLTALASEIGGVTPIACDLKDREALGNLVTQSEEALGTLDILVNNAGITRDGLLLTMTDEDFDKVIAINLKAAFVASRAAAKSMMRNFNGGSISLILT
ncbi:MAG: SDR family NAD(P)-dependent oxidoreductase, partial [Alphaproteobacteria bacterium]